MIEVKSSFVDRAMELFEGYDAAYGTYEAKPGGPNVLRGKVEIKSSAKTIRSELTPQRWKDHLEGKSPLGVIPIRDNNTVLWGCIDVDSYGVSHLDLVKKLKSMKLPLLVCRSKSGGAHVFLFMAEPVPASDMQEFLREIAVAIGWGASEIFPKQRTVHLDRGDLGSWLNMPYFGGDETDRYCVDDQGRSLTLSKFLDLAESLKQPAVFISQSVETFTDSPDAKPNHDFGDAPPCMQHLSKVGFPEGTRNKGLLALGVFAKKKFGTKWPETLERWNRELMDPPLPSSEVVDVIRGLERKDYFYTCKDQPLLAHCNSAVCRTRKYGVGGDDDYPSISGMSVLNTDPPLWFLDVEDQRIELTTEELQNFKYFQRVCMEQLFRTYRTMKQDAWLQVVGEAMRNAVRIEAPKEVGKTGHFYDLLEEFLTDKHCGDAREDLLVGRPYLDEEQGRYYFRLQDLSRMLENNNFRSFSRGQITTRLRQKGGNAHFFNIKGKGVNVWYVPAEAFQRMPTLDIPALKEDPL